MSPKAKIVKKSAPKLALKAAPAKVKLPAKGDTVKVAAKPATKSVPLKGAPKGASKGAKETPAPLLAAPGEGGPDADELEEAADEAAASSSGGSSAALAAAAAGGATEMSASFKNFRNHPDMENFYRFIFDNDLRHEALDIIDEIMIEKQNRRQLKSAKSLAH